MALAFFEGFQRLRTSDVSVIVADPTVSDGSGAVGADQTGHENSMCLSPGFGYGCLFATPLTASEIHFKMRTNGVVTNDIVSIRGPLGSGGEGQLLSIQLSRGYAYAQFGSRSIDSTSLGPIRNIMGRWCQVRVFFYCYCLNGNLGTSWARLVLVINGTTVLDYAGNSAYAAGWGLVETQSRISLAQNPGAWLDDVAIFSQSAITTSAAPSWNATDELKVYGLLPNGDVSVSWTPNTGANSAAVDEAVVDDATTYVASTVAGQEDRYDFEALSSVWPAGSAIHAVGLTVHKLDAALTAAPIVRVGGTTYELTSPAAVGANTSNYRARRAWSTVNPSTGVAWTEAEVDALEAGVISK